MLSFSFKLDNMVRKIPFLRWLMNMPIAFGWPANFWSLIRLIGILIIIPCYTLSPYLGFIAFILLLTTDGLDGYMARHKNSVKYEFLDPFVWIYVMGWIGKEFWHNAGEWFDPLADKIFIASCFIYFGIYLEPIIYPNLFIILVIIEVSAVSIVIPLIRKVIMKRPISIKANKLGKLKFVIESLIGTLLMVYYLFGFSEVQTLAELPVFITMITLINALMMFAIFLAVGSVVGHIFPEWFRKLKLLTLNKRRRTIL